MIKQLRYFIMGLVFFLVILGNKDLRLNTAYSLEVADNPTAYLVGKAREKRIVLIGTHHRNAFIHNLITSSLPSLVKDAGINTMFVEIPTSQQQVINQFIAGKLGVESIRISEIVTSPSFQEVLKQAQILNMAIIAIDTEIPAPISRDEWMSKQVITYMQEHPKDKGIIVVGARHVLKGVEWSYSHAPSLADYLKEYSIFSVVPWPDAPETNLPIAMDITPVRFGGVRVPLLNSMNIQSHVSLASVADGVILLPRDQ